MEANTCTEANTKQPEPAEADARLTLSQAARIAPGSPSPNCVWRWCRRGVLARSGERVRLQHVRIGGKLFTTARWLNEFGRCLAEADATYFKIADREADEAPREQSSASRRAGRASSAGRSRDADEARRARIREELEAEGL